MTIAGMPTTWQVKTGSIGNLPTCDVLWSSKSVMFFHTLLNSNSTWRDNPAYIPFQFIDIGGASIPFIDDATNPWGFTRWLSPATFKRGTLYVNESSNWDIPFKVYLAEDGPVIDGGITGGPIKKRQIYHFKISTDPERRRNMIYDGPDIQMFSGHSYGYLFELDDPVPSLPTTKQLFIDMTSVIYFGGAGN